MRNQMPPGLISQGSQPCFRFDSQIESMGNKSHLFHLLLLLMVILRQASFKL